MPPPPPLQHRQNGRTQCHEKPKKLSFADNAVSHATPATPSPNAPLSIPQRPSIHTSAPLYPYRTSLRAEILQYSASNTRVFGLKYSSIQYRILLPCGNFQLFTIQDRGIGIGFKKTKPKNHKIPYLFTVYITKFPVFSMMIFTKFRTFLPSASQNSGICILRHHPLGQW